jgi:hypothetical protein
VAARELSGNLNNSYIASNFYLGLCSAIRVPHERLQISAAAFAVSGTATNPTSAFGGDYNDFAELTNGQTIEVDFSPFKANGFTYTTDGDLFVFTFRASGGVVPLSVLVEAFDNTLEWRTLGTVSTFEVFSQGSKGVLRLASAYLLFVTKIRITVASSGVVRLVAWEWFPSRSSAEDPSQFVPTISSGAPCFVYALQGLRVRRGLSGAEVRLEPHLGRMSITDGAAAETRLTPGSVVANAIPAFASDAAAAAASTLPQGGFYTLTGETVLRRKP